MAKALGDSSVDRTACARHNVQRTLPVTESNSEYYVSRWSKACDSVADALAAMVLCCGKVMYLIRSVALMVPGDSIGPHV